MSQHHSAPPLGGCKVRSPPGFTPQDIEKAQWGIDPLRESHNAGRRQEPQCIGVPPNQGDGMTPEKLSYGYQSYVELGRGRVPDRRPLYNRPPTNNFFHLPPGYSFQSSDNLGFPHIFPGQNGPALNPQRGGYPHQTEGSGHHRRGNFIPQSKGDNLDGSGSTLGEILSETDDHEIDKIIRSVEYSFTQNEWDTIHEDLVHQPDGGTGMAQAGNHDRRGETPQRANTFSQTTWGVPEPGAGSSDGMNHGNIQPETLGEGGISDGQDGAGVGDVDYVFSPTDWDQPEVSIPPLDSAPINREHPLFSEGNAVLNTETDNLIETLHSQLKEGGSSAGTHLSPRPSSGTSHLHERSFARKTSHLNGGLSARQERKAKSQPEVESLGDSDSLSCDEQLLLESLLTKINSSSRRTSGKKNSVRSEKTGRNDAPRTNPTDSAESVVHRVVDGEYHAKETNIFPPGTESEILTFPATIPTVESFRKRGQARAAALPDLDSLTKRDHLGTSKETPVAAPTPSKTAKLQEEKTLKKQRTIPAPQPGDLVLTEEEKLWLGVREEVVEAMEVDEDCTLGSERNPAARKRKGKSKKGRGGHQNSKMKTLFSNAMPYNLEPQRNPASSTTGLGNGEDKMSNTCEHRTLGTDERERPQSGMARTNVVDSGYGVSEPDAFRPAVPQRFPDDRGHRSHPGTKVEGDTFLRTASDVRNEPAQSSANSIRADEGPSIPGHSAIPHMEGINSRTEERGRFESKEVTGNITSDERKPRENEESLKGTNDRKKRLEDAEKSGDRAKQQEASREAASGSKLQHRKEARDAEKPSSEARPQPDQQKVTEGSSTSQFELEGVLAGRRKADLSVKKSTRREHIRTGYSRAEEETTSRTEGEKTSQKGKKKGGTKSSNESRKVDKGEGCHMADKEPHEAPDKTGSQGSNSGKKPLSKDQQPSKQGKTRRSHRNRSGNGRTSPSNAPPPVETVMSKKDQKESKDHDSRGNKEEESSNQPRPKSPPVDTTQLGATRGKKTRKDRDRTGKERQTDPSKPLPNSDPPLKKDRSGNQSRAKSNSGRKPAAASEAPPVDNGARPGASRRGTEGVDEQEKRQRDGSFTLPRKNGKSGNQTPSRSNSGGRKPSAASEAPPADNGARRGASQGGTEGVDEREECQRDRYSTQTRNTDKEEVTPQGGKSSAGHGREGQGSFARGDGREWSGAMKNEEENVRSGNQEAPVGQAQPSRKEGVMRTFAAYAILLASSYLLHLWGLRYHITDRVAEFGSWLLVFVQIIVLCILALVRSTFEYYGLIFWSLLCDIAGVIKRALYFVGGKLTCVWDYFLRPSILILILLLYMAFYLAYIPWRICRGLWLSYKEPGASRWGKPGRFFFQFEEATPPKGRQEHSFHGSASDNGASGECNGNSWNGAGAPNGGHTSGTSTGHARGTPGSGHATSNGFTPRSNGIHSAGVGSSSEPSSASTRDTSQESEQAISRILSAGDVAYDILGVSRLCPSEEIKKVYRKLAVLVHPDKSEHPDSQRAFQKLQGAHDKIGDKESRRRYDEEIRQQEYASNLMSQQRQGFMMFCSRCMGHHQKNITDRMSHTARYCSRHNSYHPAYDDDIWVETTLMGLSKVVYLCEDSIIYDITEWAKCNNILELPANSCEVFVRLSYGPAQRRSQPFHNMDDIFRHFSSPSGQSGRGKGQPRTRGRKKRNNNRR